MGAARDFAQTLYGGPAIPRERAVTVGTAVVELVPGHPDRLHLLVVNHGSAPVTIKSGRGVTLTNGYRLPPGGTMSWRVELDGEELADRFDAISSAAGQNLYVREVIRSQEGAV